MDADSNVGLAIRDPSQDAVEIGGDPPLIVGPGG
jgi:hypothetical protein